MTRVINIRNVPENWQSNPDYIYIGRAGKGFDGYFGNPYLLRAGQQHGSTLDKYEIYFNNRIKIDKEFRDKVNTLKDKILVCFCKPHACHGDIIAEFLNQTK